jgi:ATP-dependent RNA helicase DHX57
MCCFFLAETSITIDDITHVIDSGFMKEQRFNPLTRMNILQEIFISRANASQRSGRAGRIQEGICWRCYDDSYFNSTSILQYPIPEIKRVSLEEIILQIIYLKLDKKPELFLSQCLDAPSLNQIKDATATLIEIKAIHYRLSDNSFQEVYGKDEKRTEKVGKLGNEAINNCCYQLTSLGYHLARMPVSVRIGKMLIYSCLLGCEEEILIIASSLSSGNKSVFSAASFDKRDDARRIHLSRYVNKHHQSLPSEGENKDTSSSTTRKESCQSDHMATVNAFNEWLSIYQNEGKDAGYQYCRRNYLSNTVLSEIKATREYYRNYLIQSGFLANYTEKPGRMSRRKREILTDFFEENPDVEDSEGEEISEQSTKPLSTTELSVMKKSEDDHHDILIRCSLCAGLFPNVIRGIRVANPSNDKGYVIKFVQGEQQNIILHPASLLSRYVFSF